MANDLEFAVKQAVGKENRKEVMPKANEKCRRMGGSCLCISLELVNEQRSITVKNVLIQSAMLMVLALLFVSGTAGVAFGTLVYEDNFDNVAFGADPSPTVGTWGGGNANAGNGTGGAPPSSANYLDSNLGTSQLGYVGILTGAPLAPGTTIHVEMQINARSSYPVIGIAADASGIDPTNATTANPSILSLYGLPDGSGIAAETPGGSQATFMTYLPNTWQLWEIDYVVGAASFTLTVGGVGNTFNGTHMMDPAATGLGAVFVKGYAGQTLVDDVLITSIPEPASLGLLVIGGLMMLRRRSA